MSSLTTKLTLAFLLIGILGASLVAVLTSRSTRTEFDRFVYSKDTQEIAAEILAHYVATGGWTAESERLPQYNPQWGFVMLVDAEGQVLFQPPNSHPSDFAESVILTDNDEKIGTLYANAEVVPRPNWERYGGSEGSPETRFLDNVFRASLLSALAAGGAALLVGIVLSRGLTRPIRALTEATQQMTKGELGTQVDVRGEDEIGRLATAFNQMSHDLAEASQKRKQLTADIAHDLRTPLAILRGYMEGLKDGSLQGTSQLYGIMFEEVEHLEHLVQDLRTLSLADAGQLPLNKSKVAPKALLERTGLAYIMQAEQQGLELRIESADDLPPIHVDTARMTQVLNNLVSNALRFTEQGAVVLRATASNGSVLLQVQDTGRGIKPDALPHVFDRFYRVDASRQREADGTVSSGLGLAIAQALVQAHEGEIRVESISAETNPTQAGTTFTIMLPPM